MSLRPKSDTPGDVAFALAQSCGEYGWRAEAAMDISDLILAWWKSEGFAAFEGMGQSPQGDICDFDRRELHARAVRFVRMEMANRRPRGAPRFLPGFVIMAIITAIISYAVQVFLDYVTGNRRVAAALAN